MQWSTIWNDDGKMWVSKDEAEEKIYRLSEALATALQEHNKQRDKLQHRILELAKNETYLEIKIAELKKRLGE